MKVGLVGMIYKSTDYLNFMKYMIYKYCMSSVHDVRPLIIANDAADKVLNSLPSTGIPYLIYNDNNPNDYYLNRVYRAWNFGAANADGEIIVFINSDFGYSYGWLDKLLSHAHSDQIPTSRLVESGKMPSGKWGITNNFGRSPSEFTKNELEFNEFSKNISIPGGAEYDGLYMPCAIRKDIFLDAGGYPEGNIKNSDGTITSGDKHFFDILNQKYGIKHVTAMDSIVYHIQEGEKDE